MTEQSRKPHLLIALCTNHQQIGMTSTASTVQLTTGAYCTVDAWYIHGAINKLPRQLPCPYDVRVYGFDYGHVSIASRALCNIPLLTGRLNAAMRLNRSRCVKGTMTLLLIALILCFNAFNNW